MRVCMCGTVYSKIRAFIARQKAVPNERMCVYLCAFLDGYCSTVQGLLDRLEVDRSSVLQCVAACCSVLQFAALYRVCSTG